LDFCGFFQNKGKKIRKFWRTMIYTIIYGNFSKKTIVDILSIKSFIMTKNIPEFKISEQKWIQVCSRILVKIKFFV
jgi:cytoplasmic iron level regulating protein YaaA (DUF328/UPF0246 family)